MQSRMIIFPLSIIPLILGVFLLPANVHAQDGAQPAIVHPRPLAPGRLAMSAGFTLLTVPRDISEEELNIAPALNLQAVLGLPWQFGITARASIQYVTNDFQAGLRWSHTLGPFSAGVGYELAWWFGFMNIDGFDNRMNGIMHHPYAAVGTSVEDVDVTLKCEAIIVTSLHSYAGENAVAKPKNSLAGGALTFMLEQPLWDDVRVMLGLRLAWTQFFHQTWFVFSTFDRRLLFPELVFGFIL